MKSLPTASLALLLAGVAAPALAQTPDWSGPYVGIFGGYVQPDDDENESIVFDRDFDGQFDDAVVLNGSGANAFSPGFCGDQIDQGATCDDDGSGVEAGVKLGYDMQFGSFVIGAVGEVAATDVEDSATGFSTTPAYYSFSRNLEQMAALRARVGYAFGDALVYATAGVAYGKVDNSFATSNGANSFTVSADENDADGHQFGGGMEWRLAPGLTLTGEYIYSDLETGDYTIRVGRGTAAATNPFVLAPNTAGTDMKRSTDSFQAHALRLGMNVRF